MAEVTEMPEMFSEGIPISATSAISVILELSQFSLVGPIPSVFIFL